MSCYNIFYDILLFILKVSLFHHSVENAFPMFVKSSTKMSCRKCYFPICVIHRHLYRKSAVTLPWLHELRPQRAGRMVHGETAEAFNSRHPGTGGEVITAPVFSGSRPPPTRAVAHWRSSTSDYDSSFVFTFLKLSYS